MFWPEHAPRDVLEEMIRGVASDTEGSDKNSTKEQKPSTALHKNKTSLQAVPKTAQAEAVSEDDSISEGSNSEIESQPKEKKPPVLKRIK